MSEKMKNTGVYFLKDSAISNSDKDYFKHEHFSNIIENIIEKNNAPFNIAIIGKWGIGKSSLIQFIGNYFKNDTTNYIYHEINAWKYEKEALRKVFLKQIWLKLNKVQDKNFKEKSAYKDFVDKISNIKVHINYNKKTTREKFISVGVFLLQLIGMVAIFLVAHLIIAFNSLPYKDVNLVFSSIGQGKDQQYFAILDTIMNSIKGNSFTVFFSSVIVLALKELFSTIKSTSMNKFNINQPLKTADDFEIELEEQLENNKDLKIVTVIDDLDRLSTSKIVEALDAIKAFVNFKNCIFIVPFDDGILKKALDKSKKQLNYSSDCEIIESELFLDKLFQFKMYLPPLVEQDMRDYAWKLCENEVTDLIELCGKDLFKSILYSILIHSYVTTPRQVKKIINNFANNLLIAIQREGGKVEEKLLLTEKGKRFLAKISVLQVDYNDFYDELVNNNNLIEEFIYTYNNPENENISSDIKKYFTKDNKIQPRYQALGSFLTRTADIKTDSIETFIYLAQDNYTRIAGDKNSKIIDRALRDGDSVPIKELLNVERSKYPEFIINRIENMNIIDLPNGIKAGFDIIENMDKNMQMLFVNLLSKKMDIITENNLLINFNSIKLSNIINVYKLAANKKGINQLIIDLFNDREKTIDKKNKSRFTDEIDLIIMNSNEIDDSVKAIVKEIIDHIIDGKVENYNVFDYFEKNKEFMDEYIFNYYFGVDFYIKFIQEIRKKEEFVGESYKILENILNLLIKTQEIDCIITPIVELFEIDDLIKDTCKLIQPYYKEITQNYANDIIINIANRYKDDYQDNILEILENTEWQISEEKQYSIIDNDETKKSSAEIIDDLLLKLIKKKFIDKILEKCKINKTVCLLNGIVSYINKNILLTDENDKEFAHIITEYSDLQITEIVSILDVIFTNYSNIDEKKLKRYSVIVPMIKSNNEIVSKFLTNLASGISNIKSYYNSYPLWSKSLLLCIAELFDFLNENQQEIFINLIINNIIVNSTQLGFISLNAINHLPEKYCKECAVSVISQADKLDLGIILLYLRKLIMQKAKDMYSPYAKFLINKVDRKEFTDEIIKDLNFFGSLGDLLVDFITKINKLEDSMKEKAMTLSIKFFENSEDRIKIVDKFVSITSEVDILFEIMNKSVTDPAQEIVVPLINNMTQDTDKDKVYNTLCLQTKYKDFINAEDILRITDLCLQASNQYIEETIELIKEQYKNYFKRTNKKKISDQLYNVFVKTSSEELRHNIIDVVKELGLNNQFYKLDFNDIDISEYR